MTRQACVIHQLNVDVSGRRLLSSLSFQLPYAQRTGLTGRNGRGKSLLLSALAGRLNPPASMSGSVHWQTNYAFLSQLQRVSGETIAQTLGIDEIFQRFSRLEQGHASEEDYILAEGYWHLPAQWQATLGQASLPEDLSFPLEKLSEGQKTRLVLCRLFLLKKHYLLLDEPSNHLDAEGRHWLIEKISQHSAGCLVISHDRVLLDSMETMLALQNDSLHSYTGNYTHYEQQYRLQVDALMHSVEEKKRGLERLYQQQQKTLVKVGKREQAGKKLRHSGSQPKILLDFKKERAGQSLGKLTEQQERQLQEAKQQLQQEKGRLEQVKPQQFHFSHERIKRSKTLWLQDVNLVYGYQKTLSFTLFPGERVHIAGTNGSGKSTLLRTIHGELEPVSGEMNRFTHSLHLDQNFRFLDETCSALENLTRLNPVLTEQAWRNLLGQLRLRGDKAIVPLGQLSGGERLKVALLAISHHDKETGLLLLDEPENHLDIESRELLAQTIKQFPGTVLLVSHDPRFVNDCEVTRAIHLL